MEKEKRNRSAARISLAMGLLGGLHPAILVALLLGAVDAVIVGEQAVFPTFFRGLLFAVPVIVSRYLEKKCPFLSLYILLSLVLSALSWPLLATPLAMIPTGLLCAVRMKNRLSEDAVESSFDRFFFPVLAFFPVIFLVSMVADKTTLQQASVVAGALYFLLCVLWHGLNRMLGYLELNQTMANLPARRISRMAGLGVMGLLVAGMILLLPPAIRFSGKVRFHFSQNTNYTGSFTQEASAPAPQENMNMEFLKGLAEEPAFQIPPIVSHIFFVVAITGVLALGCWGVYRMFLHFRSSYRDERDVVQFLSREKTDPGKMGKKDGDKIRPGRLDFSPTAVARRKYRRLILRHSKEHPRHWATPKELETAAGLTREELHAVYEKARYGESGITREELRNAFKNG